MPPVEPQLAATILLLRDDPLRVLMVKRHANAFFPSAQVFPGGKVDAADYADDWLPLLRGHEDMPPRQRALRIAACRETWEEAGILPCATGAPAHDRAGGQFRDLIATLGASLDLSEMAHFGHWITPPHVEKRFDTHFFLARAPDIGEGLCDGREIVSTDWVEPLSLIDRAEAGDPSILFSTLMNIHCIAQCTTVEDALRVAKARDVVTVMPRPLDEDGARWVVIPEGAGYPVTRVRYREPTGNA